MAENKNRMNNEPVFGSLAYDLNTLNWEQLDGNAVRQPQEPLRRPERDIRPQREPRRRPAARPREHASPILVGGVAVLALMVVVLMMGYVKLALGVAYEKAFDQAAVKAAAQAAGMTKPTSDQIEYIELGGADMAEICRPESTGPLAQAWTWLKDGIGAVVEYFR